MKRMANMTTKQQTEACERIRAFLQSIASFAVSAQDEIGTPDVLLDSLASMQSDMDVCVELASKLAMASE
jgi:hypothetical protein